MIKYTLDEIDEVAKTILAQSKHKLILFYGDMGAGKTTLIKAMVKALGVAHETNSPTFSLVNEYISNNQQTIYHFDLYRIESIEEALDFGIEEYINTNNWLFIEWPQIILSLLDKPYTSLYLTMNTTNERSIELKN